MEFSDFIKHCSRFCVLRSDFHKSYRIPDSAPTWTVLWQKRAELWVLLPSLQQVPCAQLIPGQQRDCDPVQCRCLHGNYLSCRTCCACGWACASPPRFRWSFRWPCPAPVQMVLKHSAARYSLFPTAHQHFLLNRLSWVYLDPSGMPSSEWQQWYHPSLPTVFWFYSTSWRCLYV